MVRLLEYSYEYDCQGTTEKDIGYALISSPNVTFDWLVKKLFEKRYTEEHRIILGSVKDLTIVI